MKKLQMISYIKDFIIFSKVLEREKRKEEQSHILKYQKEIKDRVRHYRSMELDIQEKVIKDREEREAKASAKEDLASTNASIGTSLDTGKGKSPMEEIPQTFVEQQVKAYLHTLEQIKQRLRKMTSTLDTQEVATSQPTEASQVTTVGENTQSEQT